MNCERDLWPRVICMRKIVSGLFRFRLASYHVGFGLAASLAVSLSLSLSLVLLSLSLSLGKFVVSFMGDASECLARRRRQRLRRQLRQRRLLLLRYAIEDRRARLGASLRESESEWSSKTQRYIQPGANDKATRVQQNQHTPTCVESMP